MRGISFQHETTNVVLNLERLVWCKQYGNTLSVLLNGDGVSQVFQFKNKEEAGEIFHEIIKSLEE